MSAAGRGERVDKDQYPTPAWCVERLCESVPLPWGTEWCEPGAGAGRIIQAANVLRKAKEQAPIVYVDKRKRAG